MREILSFTIGIVILFSSCGRSDQQSNGSVEQLDTGEFQLIEEKQVEWTTYKDSVYHFQLEVPKKWSVYRTPLNNNLQAINIFDPKEVDKEDLPLSIHNDASVSHVSFYPKGWGTELPGGRSKSWEIWNGTKPVDFDVKSKDSHIFQLEDRNIWGYIFQPASPPSSWSEHGYMFARISVDNFKARCIEEESKDEIPMVECDPYIGDSIVYSGQIDTMDKAIIEKVVASIEFMDDQVNEKSNLIQIDQPESGAVVHSPLIVTGKARGYWYFEGDFPILLKDNNGNIIAESYATSKGDWMTEDFVPFSGTIKFKRSDLKNGLLILKRANPSGRKTNENQITISVTFQ